MGTVSSSLPTGSTNSVSNGTSSSSSGSSSSSNPTGIFTGTSAYSQDFQNLIERAVAIATLPITLLNNQETALTNQSNELNTIDTKFTALQNALQGITDSMSGSSFSTTVSDPNSVSVSLSDGALEGVYSINITKAGSYATSLSTAAWDATPDPSGDPSTYSLIVGGQSYSFTPADNSAATVASTINSQYGNMLHATAVNVSTSDSPIYKISLQSTSLGEDTLDIQNSLGASLQTPQQPGEKAEYEIDNSGVSVESTSRSVAIANGVNLTILKASSGPVDVTVTPSTSALGTALSTFADAYNATVDELGKQRGQTAGPLEGQAIVNTLSQVLSSISTYGSGSSISTLEGVGLKLDTAGHLNYQSNTLLLASFSNSAGIASFLGSATGGGFLKNAADALKNVETQKTGLLKVAETDMQTQISNLAATIMTKQNKVSDMQLQLQNQMAQADAAIASMEQQYSYLSSMFSAMQTADQMYSH
jgi:flagellar hook-associated protein 2